MDKITIVCCWNKFSQYERLIESIEKQNISVNIIGIDNSKQIFESCSKALNSVLPHVKTKYVLFSHQDIIFNKNNDLQRILKYLDGINQNDILGFAGVSFNNQFVKTNVRIGDSSKGKYGGSIRVHGLEECDTLDECIFGGYTTFFLNHPFDETICNSWHLYTVEMCLRTKINQGKVYICDIELFHDSWGNIDISYIKNFYKICKKYKNEYKFIRTPCCFYSGTSFILRGTYFLKKYLGLVLRRNGFIK